MWLVFKLQVKTHKNSSSYRIRCEVRHPPVSTPEPPTFRANGPGKIEHDTTRTSHANNGQKFVRHKSQQQVKRHQNQTRHSLSESSCLEMLRLRVTGVCRTLFCTSGTCTNIKTAIKGAEAHAVKWCPDSPEQRSSVEKSKGASVVGVFEAGIDEVEILYALPPRYTTRRSPCPRLYAMTHC
ncbi:hypothetical protein F2P81_024990 [Scophthalmus maximus]|uniref:Uncharacterized protein n=1 Tax=Scophthalmus maximus TaxID=52904 RepID=A0A6A4RRU8_SCOMX|nr:hypothetical protein F2P81_024990 [Scophthalmus maximus]